MPANKKKNLVQALRFIWEISCRTCHPMCREKRKFIRKPKMNFELCKSDINVFFFLLKLAVKAKNKGEKMRTSACQGQTVFHSFAIVQCEGFTRLYISQNLFLNRLISIFRNDNGILSCEFVPFIQWLTIFENR